VIDGDDNEDDGVISTAIVTCELLS